MYSYYIMNFEDVLRQFTKIEVINEPLPEKELELEDELRYTDYYKNQGLAHIKKQGKITLDDPLINAVLELEVPKIKTPQEDYCIRNNIKKK